MDRELAFKPHVTNKFKNACAKIAALRRVTIYSTRAVFCSWEYRRLWKIVLNVLITTRWGFQWTKVPLWPTIAVSLWRQRGLFGTHRQDAYFFFRGLDWRSKLYLPLFNTKSNKRYIWWWLMLSNPNITVSLHSSFSYLIAHLFALFRSNVKNLKFRARLQFCFAFVEMLRTLRYFICTVQV